MIVNSQLRVSLKPSRYIDYNDGGVPQPDSVSHICHSGGRSSFSMILLRAAIYVADFERSRNVQLRVTSKL